MKQIIIVISIVVILLQLYIGFPTGKRALNIKFIDAYHSSEPDFNADSAQAHYIDATLETGEKIRIQSTNRLRLGFTGGNSSEAESL